MDRSDPPRTVAFVLSALVMLELTVAGVVGLLAWRSPNLTMQPRGQLVWLAIHLLLLWAIWRRSAVALYVLCALVAVPAVLLLLSVSELQAWVVTLLVGASVQLALLLSPPVRRHVGRAKPAGNGGDAVRANGTPTA